MIQILILLALLTTPYIDNVHVVEKNHKVTLEWQQTQKALVMVYKLADRKLANNCPETIDTFGKNCQVIWQRRNLVGNIRVTDKHYKGGDEYFVIQYVYQSHNGAYGPFIPTYR